MGHGGDVVDELTTDHREVEEFFERFHQAPHGSHDRKRLLDQVTVELVRHSVAEEQHLYPAVREHLPLGGKTADKELAEHAQVEQMLKDLEGMEPADPAFDSSVRALQREVTAHIHDEESTLFVLLRRTFSEDMLGELGEKVRTAKKVAPTRPHPSTPSTPPANKLIDPGVGLVDRARDLLTGRGR
ncbi:hemerythrin domain-containing protein [Streptomyces sp. WMMC500]|uniref:hemerythrin domain-containing protein n=1 Tax=Streptomyces sp. WMMC500 TaxID=3015154 RepID=UPI00248BEE4E|nr:hemerythrin domain-containing protein [Streptomyces sp. WMMC500]WBB62522.1 hemerythrin domain-containing protein [Streptomyces sp. WMMC500]